MPGTLLAGSADPERRPLYRRRRWCTPYYAGVQHRWLCRARVPRLPMIPSAWLRWCSFVLLLLLLLLLLRGACSCAKLCRESRGRRLVWTLGDAARAYRRHC